MSVTLQGHLFLSRYSEISLTGGSSGARVKEISRLQKFKAHTFWDLATELEVDDS
jgi:hypothetical protein